LTGSAKKVYTVQTKNMKAPNEVTAWLCVMDMPQGRLRYLPFIFYFCEYVVP